MCGSLLEEASFVPERTPGAAMLPYIRRAVADETGV